MSATRTGRAGSASLPDALRERSDRQLEELFLRRPDLIMPMPTNIDQLAGRAGSPSSLQRALDRLDRFALAVVEAIVVFGPRMTVQRLREVLPPADSDDRLASRLDELRTSALVFGPDDHLSVPRATADVLGAFPAGLGPTSETPLDAEQIEAELAEAGSGGRALVEQLASGPPVGLLPDAPERPASGPVGSDALASVVGDLIARRLLVQVDVGAVALPREVGLHMRGGRLLPPGALDPPAPSGRRNDVSRIEQAAVGTALELIRRVEQVLEEWGRSGPGTLKTTGLGVRDLRRLTGELGVDEHTAATYLETAAAAGLIGLADGPPARWAPTPAYDRWRADSPARRWATLVTAWLETTRAPGLVGTRDEKDRPRAVLSRDIERAGQPEYRRLALEILAAAPPGTEVTADDVIAAAGWQRPRWLPGRIAGVLRDILTEAAALGVTALGAISGPGRALLAAVSTSPTSQRSSPAATSTPSSGGPQSAAAAALEPLLPAPVDHVLLQADLTAIAPGPLQPPLARALALMAEPESHGGASVYRFTPESVRRALDAGRTRAQLHDLLETHSRTPVPQPLTYLIDDMARRHGRIRVGSATSYLRCDDEPLLETLLADSRTVDLGLRSIAPTVLVSRVNARTLVEELRGLGYAPASEGPDGALVLTAPPAIRAEERALRPAHRPGPPTPEVRAAAVRALRVADRARAARPTSNGNAGRSGVAGGSGRLVQILRTAIVEGTTIWIDYIDQHGISTERIIDPVRIEAGQLTAFDHGAARSRDFMLHRITSVAAVE